MPKNALAFKPTLFAEFYKNDGHSLTFLGCFQDSGTRLLQEHRRDYPGILTNLRCVKHCAKNGFIYAGTEYGQECYCGNVKPRSNLEVDPYTCNMKCAGDPDETCGGFWRLALYSTNYTEYVEDVLRFRGCYKDSGKRILSGHRQNFPGKLTNLICVKHCAQKGFNFAGTEYGQECFCGNSEPSAELLVVPSECKMPCAGDRDESCGAVWRMSVYSTVTEPECGIPSVTKTLSGSNTKPGEFPWLTAIYQKTEDNKWEQQCGGILITAHIVITAAHCLVDRENVPLQPNEIRVGLGKYLKDFYSNETTSIISEVKEVVVPRHYVGSSSYYAWDIGLLDLVASVKGTPFIMPACVDLFSDFEPTPDAEGEVAGWGKKNGGLSSEVVLSRRLKYIKYEQCMDNLRASCKPLLTQDKFCGGNVEGSQVEKGDSGGGLTFLKDGKHFLIGVVSTKVPQDSSFSLFIDVTQHSVWLEKERNRLRHAHTKS